MHSKLLHCYQAGQVVVLVALLSFNIFSYFYFNNELKSVKNELEVLKQVVETKNTDCEAIVKRCIFEEAPNVLHKKALKIKGDGGLLIEDNFEESLPVAPNFEVQKSNRYKRSQESSRKGLSCYKGEKGARGVRGPPGLPGKKGESVCPCFPTTVGLTTPAPTIGPRKYDCRISMAGIPLYQRNVNTFWGSWMKDSFKESTTFKNFVWLTSHLQGHVLYGYENLKNFKSNVTSLTVEIPEWYSGTGHVIYNGMFIYHKALSNEIVMFDLTMKEIVASVSIPKASFRGDQYLYNTNYTYFDLAVDENGLWVIYTTEKKPNYFFVSNLNTENLTIQETWVTSVESQNYSEGFIVCGRLYLIQDVTAVSTVIHSEYDLYTKNWTTVNLKFKNPYQRNTMISYNPVDKKVYSWNNGHLLTYTMLID